MKLKTYVYIHDLESLAGNETSYLCGVGGGHVENLGNLYSVESSVNDIVFLVLVVGL